MKFKRRHLSFVVLIDGRRMLAVALIAALAGFVAVSHAGAAESKGEPSMAETLQFLSGLFSCAAQITATGTGENPSIRVTTNFERSKYEIKVVGSQVQTVGDVRETKRSENTSNNDIVYSLQDSYTYRATAALSSLSPVVKVTDRFIGLECTTGTCWSAQKSGREVGQMLGIPVDRSSEETKSERLMNYLLCSKEDAERAAKAFAHLIRLGGGKASPF